MGTVAVREWRWNMTDSSSLFHPIELYKVKYFNLQNLGYITFPYFHISNNYNKYESIEFDPNCITYNTTCLKRQIYNESVGRVHTISTAGKYIFSDT